MKVLVFKDEKEDVQLKENLEMLGFYNMAECETMSKKDILLMYQAFGDDLKIIMTPFIMNNLNLEINQLLDAINIKISEFDFYSQFKAKEFEDLKIIESLRIKDLFKKSLKKEDAWNSIADSLLNGWQACTVKGNLIKGEM